jgi:hypothetical protein
MLHDKNLTTVKMSLPPQSTNSLKAMSIKM